MTGCAGPRRVPQAASRYVTLLVRNQPVRRRGVEGRGAAKSSKTSLGPTLSTIVRFGTAFTKNARSKRVEK
jgi:hypothetical protein